jgi:hypothetical protein
LGMGDGPQTPIPNLFSTFLKIFNIIFELLQ